MLTNEPDCQQDYYRVELCEFLQPNPLGEFSGTRSLTLLIVLPSAGIPSTPRGEHVLQPHTACSNLKKLRLFSR